MARSRFTVALLSMLFSVAACVDLTPVTLGTGDAALTPDGGVGNECEICLLQEEGAAQCAAELTACNDDPKCPNIMRCLFDNDCTSSSNDDTVNRCALPCALGAGVTSPSDPGVVLGVNLSFCAKAACPGRCYHQP
jgi:hypothetical protein